MNAAEDLARGLDRLLTRETAIADQHANMIHADCAQRRCFVPAGDFVDLNEHGAPDRIRTCDLCLRRAALYPVELRVPRTVLYAGGRGCCKPRQRFAKRNSRPPWTVVMKVPGGEFPCFQNWP